MADNDTLVGALGNFITRSIEKVTGAKHQVVVMDFGAGTAESLVTTANPLPTSSTPTILGRTTREYVEDNGVRLAAVGASSNAALPTLGASREVRIHADTDCYLNWATSGAGAATGGASSMPLVANAIEVTVVPAAATHFAVIRKTADGFVHLTPVA